MSKRNSSYERHYHSESKLPLGDNTCVINDNAEGYRWTITSTGNIRLWNGSHSKTLGSTIDTIQFRDLTVTYDGTAFTTKEVSSSTRTSSTPVNAADAEGSVTTFLVKGETNAVTGTDAAADTLVVAGRSSEYRWYANSDDTITLYGRGTSITLTDMEYIRFDNVTLHYVGDGVFEKATTRHAFDTDRDFITMLQSSPVAVSTATLLANDDDTAVRIESPQVAASQGTVTLDDAGNIVFTPATSFEGTATVYYNVVDGDGNAEPSVMYARVQAPTETTTESLASISSTTGAILNGENAWDYAGSDVATAGDMNGDGYADIVIAAAGAEQTGSYQKGAAYVVFGSGSLGAEATDLDELDGSNGFKVTGLNGNAFVDVETAGDVNGDGYDDIIINGDASRSASYESYVVFGQASGFDAAIDVSDLDGSNGFTITDNDRNSSTVTGLASGDFNGDGVNDIAVVNNYETFVVFGSQDGFEANVDSSTLDGTNGYTIRSTSNSQWTAISQLESAGDVNGDGVDDLLLYDTRISQAFVVYGGDSDDDTIYLNQLDNREGFAVDLPSARSNNAVISGAGDINGDGYDDVIVSNQSGSAYVVYGGATGADVSATALDGSDGFKLGGAFVTDVSEAGDVNGDGIDDLIVGSKTTCIDGRSNNGATYVLFGNDEGFESTVNLTTLSPAEGKIVVGANSLDYAGNAVSAAGDVNNDGIDDLLIGAARVDSNGNNAGAAYVLYGSTSVAASHAVLLGSHHGDILVGTAGDDVITGLNGGDKFIVTTGNDVITDLLFSKGDVLDFSSLLPETITSNNIDSYVSVSQSGQDAVIQYSSTSSLTLQNVDLGNMSSASDLLTAGYIDI